MIDPLPDSLHFVTSIQNSRFSVFCRKFRSPGPPRLDDLDPADTTGPLFSGPSCRTMSRPFCRAMSPAFFSSPADTPAAYDFVNGSALAGCTFGRCFFLVGFSPAFFSSFLCHNFPSARDLANRPAPGKAFGHSFCLVNIAQVRSDFPFSHNRKPLDSDCQVLS